MSSDPKRDALRHHRSLNPHPERVTDPLFEDSDFFDPRDLVQVKYEMLRREREDGLTVTDAAARSGLSRVTFYEARRAFERSGLIGLLPKKRGPRGGHKLTAEVVAFLLEERDRTPGASATALATRVQDQFGVTVHPRSVERALLREKKQPR